MKALITYTNSSNNNETTEVVTNFPVIPYWGDGADPTTLNDTNIEIFDLVSIDVVPEEEYFLTSDGDGHDYIIPVGMKDKWNLIWDSVERAIAEGDYNDNYYHQLDIFNEQFSQYRKEGDWDKEYKITKR